MSKPYPRTRTGELKRLILIFNEEDRNIIGNSQFIFDRDTPVRDTLHEMSKYYHIVRSSSLRRIEEIFYKNIYWEDNDRKMMEDTANYVWSLVYELKGTVEERQKQVDVLQHEFMESFVDKAYAVLPKGERLPDYRVKRIVDWALKAFSFERSMLKES